MRTLLPSAKPVILYNQPIEPGDQDCACADDRSEPLVLWALDRDGETTDCACASPSISPVDSRSAFLGQAWQYLPPLYQSSLSGYEILLPAFAPAGPVVLNAYARAALDSYVQPHPLANTVARQLAALGLLAPMDNHQPALCPTAEHRTLTAWLHVTNACNLRCSYCYVSKDDMAMDESTGRAVLDSIFRTTADHGFRAVKLKYAGGEPTLNFDLVRFLHRWAGLLAEQQGVELHETLLTNGVVLPEEVLDFVSAAGMRLALSLDLSRQAHDARRSSAAGQRTFEQICHNMERAIQRGLRPYLSITLSGTSDEESAESVGLALEWDLPFNLNFVRPADGRPDERTLAGLVASVRAAFARIEAHLPQYSLLGILDRADFSRSHRHPCGAGHSYLVIDHLGRLSPCQMELRRPVGALDGDPLETLYTAFPCPPVEDRPTCANCIWRYGCAGGCPWLARRAGNVCNPSPYCAVYRALFPDLLRLEGLRLLKWGIGY